MTQRDEGEKKRIDVVFCEMRCDGSLLLDDTNTFTGEKNAFPNRNSVRGFELIDTIKARVDAACNGTVSCADILALAAKDGVGLRSHLGLTIKLLRHHKITYVMVNQIQYRWEDRHGQFLSADETQEPHPHLQRDQHRPRLRRQPPRHVPSLGRRHQPGCARHTDSNRFDNNYYTNLLTRRGLLHSDQELFNNGSQDALVRVYGSNIATFRSDFAAAMIRMGNISPLTGTNGEIRRNCRPFAPFVCLIGKCMREEILKCSD
ncbi:hypothetical protein DH2020_031871 [Rehmannia glutinosa]|uniref:peroxidase n=1 Tax=Rehmannia glutinosa TaxID=99300 RepID=A0ABR0VK36_REHGL